MKDMTKQLSKTLRTSLNWAKAHQVLISISISIVILGGFLLKVNGLINVSRDEQTYKHTVSNSDTPTFDQATLDKIKALRDSGTKNPGTDYNSGRTNPFAE